MKACIKSPLAGVASLILPSDTAKGDLRSVLIAAFVADAYSLGGHWIYDSNQIRQQLNADRLHNLNDPLSKYHAGKKAGDFTHYGNQLLASLKNIAKEKAFNSKSWFASWLECVQSNNNSDYVDHSSKNVMENIKAGKIGGELEASSDAKDNACCVRFLPLLGVHSEEEGLVKDVRKQISMIYRSEDAQDMGELFARTLHSILREKKAPIDALQLAVEKLPRLQDRVNKGIESGQAGLEDATAASEFKTSCDLNTGIPLICHFITKYSSIPGIEKALEGNMLIGGDSASRAIVIGAILTAYQGADAVPERWFLQLNRKAEIEDALHHLLS